MPTITAFGMEYFATPSMGLNLKASGSTSPSGGLSGVTFGIGIGTGTLLSSL